MQRQGSALQSDKNKGIQPTRQFSHLIRKSKGKKRCSAFEEGATA